MGTMNFARRAPEKESVEMMNKSMDAGINFIDTANVYAKGFSEEIVGKALQEAGKRNDIILAANVANNVGYRSE